MAMDLEAEIRDLKRRVGELEGSFGFLTEQVRGVHKDLLAFEARTEERFDGVDKKLREHDARFDRLDRDIKGLRTDMPKVVADTMREVLREQRGKS